MIINPKIQIITKFPQKKKMHFSDNQKTVQKKKNRTNVNNKGTYLTKKTDCISGRE